MKRGILVVLCLQAAAAAVSASAHADTFTSCRSERGFNYRAESGYSTDNPYILLKSDANGTKHFLVIENPALTGSQLIGPPSNITGIQVNKTTFEWIDTVEGRYKNVQVTFGPIGTGSTATGYVSISSTPIDTCPP